MMNRRCFVTRAAVLPLAAACGLPKLTAAAPSSPRLTAWPAGGPASLAAGKHGIAYEGAAIVAYVPASALTRSKVPVMLFLHGALRTVDFFVDGHRAAADANGVCVAAPYAAAGTWDAVRDFYGPDVDVLNSTLKWLFTNLPVDRNRIALSGFSDGATYTLGIGRANGDIFSRLIAYSPGFLLGGILVGKPPIVVSHGTDDIVIPYYNTRDVIVPTLRAEGYDVDFRSFDGPHAVPSGVMAEQMQLLGAP